LREKEKEEKEDLEEILQLKKRDDCGGGLKAK
jgi:hypothetical protein